MYFPISLPACFKSLDLASSTSVTSEITTTPAGADTIIAQTSSSTLAEAVARHLVTPRAHYTNGVQVHNARYIQWESGDTSRLSPRPPETFSCDSIASWDPAGPMPTQTGRCPEYPSRDHTFDHYGLIVGLPVAFAGLLLSVSLAFGCTRHPRDENGGRGRRRKLLVFVHREKSNISRETAFSFGLWRTQQALRKSEAGVRFWSSTSPRQGKVQRMSSQNTFSLP